ncbi:uncharacterized protein [Argopecten irradians]|uniref:uncharacterized protein isoform X2 n=1 Tax=Argopecten irradians TaxID=31199 RepID=UPI00371A7430
MCNALMSMTLCTSPTEVVYGITVCNAMVIYKYVLFVYVGLIVVEGIEACDFPETISEIQSDGSNKCRCDTKRGYCGDREDLCVRKECGENQILLRNCSCICQDNYAENSRGHCVELNIPRCKVGMIELSNGQCVMPSTVPTFNITTVSVAPAEYRQPPPEVMVTNFTSTSVTLGITIDRKDMDVLVIARIYKPLNESLLRQQEINLDPNSNMALMHIPNLTPNTSYTVAVRLFPKFARASATTIIRIQTDTYTEVFVRKKEDNLDTDNNTFIIVVIAVPLAVMLVIGLMVGIILNRKKILKYLKEKDADVKDDQASFSEVGGDTENNDTDAMDLESNKVPMLTSRVPREYANIKKNADCSPIYPLLQNTDERGQNEASDATYVKSVDNDCASVDVDITRRTTPEMSIGSDSHWENTSGPRSDILQPESQFEDISNRSLSEQPHTLDNSTIHQPSITQPNTMGSINIQVITNRGHSPSPGYDQLGNNTRYHPSDDSNRESDNLPSCYSVRSFGGTQPTSDTNTSLYNNRQVT